MEDEPRTQPGPHHPIFARVYAFMSRFGREAAGRYRQELLGGISGEVLEVGAGNGDNFAYYPAGVTRVVAVEPEPHLRKLAVAEAARARLPISVIDGVAEQLPCPDGSVDVVVTSLVLCSVADPTRALAEFHRVMRPGAELRFFEHVRASSRVSAGLQSALDRSRVWPLVAGGCHCGRDTMTGISRVFHVESCRKFSLTRLWAPTSPFVIGVARKVEATSEPVR